MDLEVFHSQLADAPTCFRSELRLYLRHPTEHRARYMTGYISALNAARLFKTEDAAWYWLAVVGRVERNPDLNGDLLAEMDNRP